ncbi:MAG: tRNA (adenosine(37)-N6)-dimethylallyltransferase MiaA [Phycisphaerales bacterium]|nr:tRNA (adenosine(37)-N6)-dimethylallyltransferase MiaA [Phycisphaerales bacterium]
MIAGPTAGGKSDLAVEIALRLGGEVVTADAFQVYRGMDIGTAKPTMEERRGVPHHLIDLVEPTERFTVAQWLGLAERAVADVRSRGRVPVVVGGTHLYVKALLDGLFDGPEPDPALRESLRALGLPALREELSRVDPAAATRIHPADERRTIRALEVFRQTGRAITEHQSQWDARPREDAVLVTLEWDADALSRRINARVRSMMERGLLDETRRLAGTLGPQAREALGYKQLLRHLSGEWTLPEAVERIKIETRRLAKNQRTWLRRLRAAPGSVWISGTDPVVRQADLVVAAVGG